MFQEVFGSEPEIQQKMDQLLDLQEKLAPTLDMNDRTTLKESIKSLNNKVTLVTSAGEDRRKQLEENKTAYTLFQVS